MAPFPSPTALWHDNTYPSISPSRPELSAKGKSVLVTGGGTGIGGETALYFAKAGASRIALLGRREQPLLDNKARIEGEFPTVEVFIAATDVTKKSEVDAAFERFAGTGSVDVLISAAAIAGPKESVNDADAEKFVDSVNFNMSGSLYVAKAFLRVAAKDAVVVDVNSAAAHLTLPELPGYAAYSVAKLAVFRLWDVLANANPALRIYHIQPGIVDTAMNREAGGIEAVGFSDDGKCDVPNAPVLCLFIQFPFQPASASGSPVKRHDFSRESICGLTGILTNSRRVLKS